jgi:hypothetical protein
MSHDWLTFVVVFLVKYLFVFVRDVLVLTNLVFAIYFVIVMLCYKHVLIKFMDFFLFTWDVRASLRAPRLILTGPEINDQVSLQ